MELEGAKVGLKRRASALCITVAEGERTLQSLSLSLGWMLEIAIMRKSRALALLTLIHHVVVVTLFTEERRLLNFSMYVVLNQLCSIRYVVRESPGLDPVYNAKK